jgi:hypothetical protein
MQFTRRIVATFAVAAAIAAMPVYAENVDIDKLQRSADTLADTLASALPFNSTLGLNWSDAYIGQLIGLPPHLGFGFAAGATTLDAEDLTQVLSDLGSGDLGDIETVFPIPGAVLEGRLGGYKLPFDIGFKVGFIPNSTQDLIAEVANDISVDYFLFGVDFRYAVLKGGGFTPKVSVGAGFNYLRGGVGAVVDGGQKFTFEDPTTHKDNVIEVTDPKVGLEWDSKVIDFKAQASWKFLIFTPYIGLGLSHGSSSAGYYVHSDITYNGDPVSDAEVQALLDDLREYNDYLAKLGQATFDIPDISSTGFESSVDVTGWSARTFGGLSFSIGWFYLDFTGLYNFSDGAYGLSVGSRLQL